jgi:cytochrome c5
MSSSNPPLPGQRIPANGNRRPLIRLLLAAGIALALVPGQGGGADYASDTRSYNLAHGRIVFEQHCVKCHTTGRREAPVFGDVDAWRQRLEQPLGTLVQHAVNGHGRMPPKGDLPLTDQQVAAAVAFVVERTRELAPATGDLGDLPATAAGARANDDEPTVGNAAVIQMFMLLYGKERWR